MYKNYEGVEKISGCCSCKKVSVKVKSVEIERKIYLLKFSLHVVVRTGSRQFCVLGKLQ